MTGARCLFGEARALMDADVRKYGMILDAAEAVERAVGVMAERLWRHGP